MRVMTYHHKSGNKSSEVHKDSNGDWFVKHTSDGQSKTMNAKDSDHAHTIAKRLVEEENREPKEYHVVHSKTQEIIGKYKSKQRARNVRDRKDTAYGANVHSIKPIYEDAPVNSAGNGGVQGIGVGPKGEPGGKKAKLIKDVLKRRKITCQMN